MEPGPDSIAMREYLYSLINLAGVRTVADIGCKQGHDLRRLGELIPGARRLVGIDISAKAIEAAQKESGSDRRYEFRVEDASERLPFADGELDLLFTLNFLECVADKQAWLREANRVLCAGGHILCAHCDWDTQVIDGSDKALVRKIVHAYADWQQPWMANADPWMGRRLWRQFSRSSLFEGRIETYGLTNTQFAEPYYGYRIIDSFAGLVRQGLISEEEHARFLSDVQAQAEQGEYFYGVTLYVYIGRKPKQNGCH